MKKLWTLMLTLAFMLMLLTGASAEQVMLHYSYGRDALSKHELDIKNTVVYKGTTYVFDFGGLSYNGAFNMYGGNIRTVFESIVPSGRVKGIDPQGPMYLGKVTISTPGPMQLYVFSGDRDSGAYTLIDQKSTTDYTMDLYATRDEQGTLRLIDRVFLYSYQEHGVEKYYAASLHISYDGYQGAPADTAPIDASLVKASHTADTTEEPVAVDSPSADLETYKSMVRVLDEERTRLSGELDQKSGEVASLQCENDTLTQQNTQLTAEVEALNAQLASAKTDETEITDLNSRIAQLEAEIATLNGQIVQQDAELAELRTRETCTPAPTQTVEITAAPMQEPTAVPTAEPTSMPTAAPTAVPTAVPTAEPTAAPEEDAEASAEADCAEHGYVHLTCKDIGALHHKERICTLCGVINSTYMPCSKCNNTGIRNCTTCHGQGMVTESGRCSFCKGTGREGSYKGVQGAFKCMFCSGTGYSTSSRPCPTCWGTNIEVCLDHKERTHCKDCLTSTLVCSVCYDMETAMVCPLCYPEEYPPFQYRSVMRSPDDSLRRQFMLTGTISSITRLADDSRGTIHSIVIRHTDPNSGATYMYNVTSFASPDAENLLVGDPVTMWGVFVGYSAELEPSFQVFHTQLTEATATAVPTPIATPEPTATPAPTPTATPEPTAAPAEVSIIRGKESVIIDHAGVKMTFDGTIEEKDNSPLFVNVLVENNTAHTIKISYSGTCNGWGLPKSAVSGNANNVSPGAKAKGYMWFRYEDLNIKEFSELKEGKLTFTVRSTDTSTELFTAPVNITFGEGEAQIVVPTFYEEFPLLPDPTAYGSMYRSSYRGASLINGVPSSSARYTYKCDRTDKTGEIFERYLAGVKEQGFTVVQSGEEYSISLGGKKVAIATCTNRITVEILPAALKSGGKASALGASDVVKKKIGGTLSTSYMTFKAEKSGKTDVIYSYEGKQPSLYHVHEAKDGSTYVYLKGTFTNKTGGEINVHNIYTNLLINGEYHYKGNIAALNSDGRLFAKYIASQDKAACYVYFEVPDSVAEKMKTAVVTLGFTPEFNTIISPAGSGTYNFDYCSDVFEITLGK